MQRLCLIASVLCLLSLSPLDSPASAREPQSSITFINRSSTAALVKLVGPSRHTVEVGDGASRKVQVAGGSYYLLVRYGSDPNKYRYTKGEPFEVRETATEYEEVSITLHTVVGGNYDARPSSPAEFSKGD